MMSLPRPKVFITILLWVISCFGLLVIWQAPPDLSSSISNSPSSKSFSNSLGSEREDEPKNFILPRVRSKPVRRTHVSNNLYLQRQEREGKDPPLGTSKIYHNLSPDNTNFLPSKVESFPKITFRNKIGSKEASDLFDGSQNSKGSVSPLKDPINVKDIKERKRLLVQHHKKESHFNKPQRNGDRRKETNPKQRKALSRTQKDTENDDDEFFDNPEKLEDVLNDINKEYDDYGDNDEETDEYEYDDYDDEDYQNDDDYDDDDGDVVDLGARYNVTPPEASLLIYNRVPKCASSTMQTILRKLSRHLNFEHISSIIYDHHQLSQDDQKELMDNLIASKAAATTNTLSYDRHLYYTNFTGIGMDPPININVVRDPVERFISSFYYRRSEDRLSRIQMNGRSASSPSFSWTNRTVEQCVLLNDTECSYIPGEEKEMMLSYFCGHQDFCRIVGSHKALQKAKQVVSKEYSVVGLVEHMDLSLLLLENLVPRFMDGALQIYETIRQREKATVNVNQQKPKVSLAIREELSRRMSDDLDFYYFLEQRLFEQKKYFLSK